MKTVIDIDEEDYNRIKDIPDAFDSLTSRVYKAIKNGTPLSKHGRLIDADKLKTHFVGTEQGTDLEVYLEPTIINAPTIIEADREVEE